jgi:hypothetical protein
MWASLLLVLFFSLTCFCSKNPQNLKSLFDAKDYFALRKAIAAVPQNSSDYLFYRGVVASKFNHLDKATPDLERYIRSVAERKNPPMLRDALEQLAEAYARGFRYREASEVYTRLLKEFGPKIKREEREGYENMVALMGAIKDAPRQTVSFRGDSSVEGNLSRMPFGAQEIQLGFDTGADLSLITASLAKKFGLKIFGSKVQVGNVAGQDVPARMGLADEITIGNAVVKNAVFLVFDDKDLFIPPDFQINGIIGLPVIAALGEITVRNDGHIEIPAKPASTGESNLCYEQLKLVLQAAVADQPVPFLMDTGASHSTLYRSFEKKFAKAFEMTQSEKHKVQGIGGYRMVKNFAAKDVQLKIGESTGTFEKIPLLMQTTEGLSKVFYGNLGLDLLKQFTTATFNFRDMTLTVH